MVVWHLNTIFLYVDVNWWNKSSEDFSSFTLANWISYVNKKSFFGWNIHTTGFFLPGFKVLLFLCFGVVSEKRAWLCQDQFQASSVQYVPGSAELTVTEEECVWAMDCFHQQYLLITVMLTVAGDHSTAFGDMSRSIWEVTVQNGMLCCVKGQGRKLSYYQPPLGKEQADFDKATAIQ